MPPQDPNREELRIALVMNGGVSLAIWIGGLTCEVSRALRREGVYGELLDLLHSEARVDVISGTSAGGINGAFLAMAMVRDQPLDLLQSLWIEKGGLTALLGNPLDPLPSSLLRGDEYFLRELENAFSALAAGGRLLSAEEAPVDLTLTTTLLHGEKVELSDDFGRAIADVRHAGRFRFRRGPDVDGEDVFVMPDLAQRLALASRGTSCFPIAFEPSFVPVAPAQPMAGRPDMKGVADFASSRFVVDGGLLDNKPLGPAIEAIYRQRISGDVRRVLLYVIPDPGESAAAGPDDPDAPPDVRSVLTTSLFQLPRVEPVAAEIGEIRLRNRRALEQREARLRLFTHIARDASRLDIWQLSYNLFPVYQERRVCSAVSYIVSQLSDGLAEIAIEARLKAADGKRSPPPKIWLERQSHRAWLAAAFKSISPLPWVPRQHPQEGSEEELEPAHWSWGIRAAEQAASQLFDLLGRTQAIVPLGHPARQAEGLPAFWNKAYNVGKDLRRLREADGTFWKKRAQSLANHLRRMQEGPTREDPRETTLGLAGWVREQLEDWRRRRAGSSASGDTVPALTGKLAHQIAELILQLSPLVRQVIAAAEASPVAEDRAAAEALAAHLDYLAPLSVRRREEVLLRLIWLEVVLHALGSSSGEPDQYVELMQVSANTPSPFGGPALAGQKLTGVQLGHFGAFYCRAWRANDWMFGRLDGSGNLVQAILNPDRLRRIALQWPREAGEPLSRAAYRRLAALAAHNEPDESSRRLLEKLDEASLLRELAYLDELDLPAPDALPLCCDALTRRLHLEILCRELVALADAVELDQKEADIAPGAGSRLLAAVRQAMAGSRHLPAEEALRIFRGHRVGEETIAGQVGTDFFTTTTARTLAVASSVLYKGGKDLGPLKYLFVGIRAVTLAFHLMGQNLTRQSRSYAAFVGAALSAGVTILVLSAFDVEIPTPVLLLAWAVVGGGLVLALFRAVFGVLVSAGLLTGLWLAWPKLLPWAPFLEDARIRGMLAAAFVLAALFGLGSLRRPRWYVALRDRWRRWKRRRRPVGRID